MKIEIILFWCVTLFWGSKFMKKFQVSELSDDQCGQAKKKSALNQGPYLWLLANIGCRDTHNLPVVRQGNTQQTPHSNKSNSGGGSLTAVKKKITVGFPAAHTGGPTGSRLAQIFVHCYLYLFFILFLPLNHLIIGVLK